MSKWRFSNSKYIYENMKQTISYTKLYKVDENMNLSFEENYTNNKLYLYKVVIEYKCNCNYIYIINIIIIEYVV